MNRVTLIMPYYINALMLAEQYKRWISYPEDIKQRLSVILVDDGSPTNPAVDVPRPAGLPELAIYRVTIDKPWHHDAARNIGVYNCMTEWMILTDVDMVLPAETLAEILELNDDNVYWLRCTDVQGEKIIVDGVWRWHQASQVMTRQRYWDVGGYDEDYCGWRNGADGLFQRKLFPSSIPDARIDDGSALMFLSNPLIAYQPCDISDACTLTLDRDDPDSSRFRIEREKKAAGTYDKPKLLSMPYVRAL